MNLTSKKAFAALAILFAASTASATVVTSLYGDIDGYAQENAYTGTFTDKYVNGSQSWTQSFAATGTITSASVELGYAALGFYSPAGVPRLFLDGSLVGSLKDMDACDGSAAPGVSSCGLNNYTIQLTSISDLATLADGKANFMIETSSGDGWVLDYSKLTVTTADAAVPEPSSIALLGLGLLGFTAARRKSFGKKN